MSGPTRIQPAVRQVSTADLLRVRAALAAGIPPAQALGSAAGSELAALARQLGLGLGLDAAARAVPISAGPLGAGPVLRALALAERCGQGAVAAVDLALATRHDALVDDQRLRARAAQATGTARLLTLLPLGAWSLLMAADPRALAFYATPLGLACAVLAGVLTLGSHLWSRRLVARAAAAAALADPLASARPPFDPLRATVVAGPLAIVLLVMAGAQIAIPVAVVVGALVARPRGAGAPAAIGALELVALLRMLLATGTGVSAALAHVAAVAPAPLATDLRVLAGQLRTGAETAEAFDGAGLAEIGAVLAVTERWGVATAEPLAVLGDALRARQRAAAETAAERVQLALVFPTTLLTVPAFVVAVVPPLVWTALAS